MTHDEIAAKIREALPEAEERTYPWGATVWELPRSEVRVSTHGVTVSLSLGAESFGLCVHPDRLDDAITIARLWATLGEPR